MQFNTWLKWSACVVTLAGAVLTSLRIDPMNIYLLNLGAVLYFVWGHRIREWNIIVINLGFIVIYAWGIFLS